MKSREEIKIIEKDGVKYRVRVVYQVLGVVDSTKIQKEIDRLTTQLAEVDTQALERKAALQARINKLQAELI